MSHAAMNSAVLLAMAKQIPCAGKMTAVFTPMTSPREFTSGPPELPGFSAASVWMILSISRPDCAHGATQRAHHAGRNRLLETVGTADGDRNLANPHGLQTAETRVNEMGRVDAQDGEVRVRIIADQGRGEHPSVRQGDFDFVGRVDDVAVRENEAIRRDDKTRSAAARVRPLVSLAPGTPHANVHHGWLNFLDDARNGLGIGVEQFSVRDRRLGLRLLCG